MATTKKLEVEKIARTTKIDMIFLFLFKTNTSFYYDRIMERKAQSDDSKKQLYPSASLTNRPHCSASYSQLKVP